MSLLIKGVTRHTGLSDKEAAGVIDHADSSVKEAKIANNAVVEAKINNDAVTEAKIKDGEVTDAKLASGVGLSDDQIAKLPTATDGQALVRGVAGWGAGSAGMAGLKIRKNSQMPILGTRAQLNFIEGAAISLKLHDNPSDDEIGITVHAKYPTKFMTLIPDDISGAVPGGQVLVPTAQVVGTNFGYTTLDFDHTNEEVGYWEWYLTPDYLNENIVVDIYWTSAGAGDVMFGFSTLGREKAENWDVALGVERTIVQTNAGAGKMNKARITTFSPGWSPGDVLLFKLARKAGDALDTIDANDVRVLKVVVSYTGRFAQSFYPLAEETLLTMANYTAWTDLDASAYIPTGATGVILHIKNAAASQKDYGFRKKGSTDDRKDWGNSGNGWALIGVDENRKFQYWLASADLLVYLVGYTATGVVFFDNAYYHEASVLDSWNTFDLSGECPGAIGIIVEMESGASWNGLRKNGSTDDRQVYGTAYHSWAIIGCDGGQNIQAHADEWGAGDYWIVGYVTEGAVFKTNADNKSIGAIDEWTDIDCSAEAPSGVLLFFELYHGINTDYQGGLRKKGETLDVYRKVKHSWAVVPCNSAQQIQGEIKNLSLDFFLVGYATWAGA